MRSSECVRATGTRFAASECDPGVWDGESDELEAMVRDVRFGDLRAVAGRELDRERARACLMRVVRILECGFCVTQLPSYVVAAAMWMAADAKEVEAAVDVIAWYCKLSDFEVDKYVTDEMLGYLCRVVSEWCVDSVVGAAVSALVVLTDPKRGRGVERVKALPVMELALRKLGEGVEGNCGFVTEIVLLVGNLFVLFGGSADAVKAICNVYDSSGNVGWRTYAMEAISVMSSWSPGEFVQFCDSGMVTRVLSGAASGYEKLARHSFNAIANMVSVGKGVTGQVVNDGFLGLILPDDWTEVSFGEYFKAVTAVLDNVDETTPLNIMETVRSEGWRLVALVAQMWDQEGYVMKTESVNLICCIVLCCDQELLRLVLDADIPLVQIICEMLPTAECPLIRVILRALNRLISLGSMIGSPNPVAVLALECDVPAMLQEMSVLESDDELAALAAPVIAIVPS